jgi:hypothetical protein
MRGKEVTASSRARRRKSSGPAFFFTPKSALPYHADGGAQASVPDTRGGRQGRRCRWGSRKMSLPRAPLPIRLPSGRKRLCFQDHPSRTNRKAATHANNRVTDSRPARRDVEAQRNKDNGHILASSAFSPRGLVPQKKHAESEEKLTVVKMEVCALDTKRRQGPHFRLSGEPAASPE